jgi:hypothetical protein
VVGGGTRWEGGLGNRRRQPTQCFDGLLAADGGSVAGLAWRRGTRGRCGVVGASTLGAMECSDEGAEEHHERRVEWRRSAVVMGRRAMTSPTDRHHDGVTHGAAAAGVVHGADVVAGQQCRCEVVAVAV